jgi:tetratricopeptide (TPR) repeat protein
MKKIVTLFNNALGIFFLLFGFLMVLAAITIEHFSLSSCFAGCLSVIASALLLSPIRKKVHATTNKVLTGWQRFTAVSLLCVFAVVVMANSDHKRSDSTPKTIINTSKPIGTEPASPVLVSEELFKNAENALNNNKLSTALTFYSKISTTSDKYTAAQAKIAEIKNKIYKGAVNYYNTGDWEEAEYHFNYLGNGYEKTQEYLAKIPEQKKNRKYGEALALMKKQDFAGASVLFAELGNFKDSETREISANNAMLAQHYQNAAKLFRSGEYEEALTAYQNLGDYKNSKEQVAKIERIVLDKKAVRLSYGQLKKNPDSHAGTFVKYNGKIFSIREYGGKTEMQVNVTNHGYGFWDDQIMVVYSGPTELEENRMVTFYGTVVGGYTYQSVAGWNMTVPLVNAEMLYY